MISILLQGKGRLVLTVLSRITDTYNLSTIYSADKIKPGFYFQLWADISQDLKTEAVSRTARTVLNYGEKFL